MRIRMSFSIKKLYGEKTKTGKQEQTKGLRMTVCMFVMAFQLFLLAKTSSELRKS